MSREEKS